MAHDPRREDYQRLVLRYALSLDDPSEAVQAFVTFGRRFAQDRDSLPQTDADRAFHLVAMATELLDYRLPFATDAAAEQLVRRATDQLDEALSLDPACYDAVRMRASLRTRSTDERYRMLAERADEVCATCAEQRDRESEALDGERLRIAEDLAMRPCLRWLASMAELALICGRNHDAIAAAERLLALDPRDVSDVRFTLVYALAKLEDEQGLAELKRRYRSYCGMRGPDDAWMLLAQVALAHKRWDLAGARSLLGRILDTYPESADALIRQTELPDGEFARLRVPAGGPDELVLAVSEGVVLLQEGVERTGRGVLGAWIAETVSELDPEAARRVARTSPAEGARRP